MGRIYALSGYVRSDVAVSEQEGGQRDGYCGLGAEHAETGPGCELVATLQPHDRLSGLERHVGRRGGERKTEETDHSQVEAGAEHDPRHPAALNAISIWRPDRIACETKKPTTAAGAMRATTTRAYTTPFAQRTGKRRGTAVIEARIIRSSTRP